MELLLAIAFFPATAGSALEVYTYMLQIKYTMFACMPTRERFLIFALNEVVAVTSTYTYFFFIRSAIYSVHTFWIHALPLCVHPYH